MANVYFLIIAIMQSIHEISISGGRPVILLPLTVVVFINGLKDFFEDWKRKISDDEENSKLARILNTETHEFEEKTWRDVKLGNILLIKENESFPADMILINSSEQNGLCYKETKNLDGETNLKFRQANARIAEHFRDESTLSQLSGTVECKPPNEFIYEFDAKMKLDPSLIEQVENGDNNDINNNPSEDFIYIDRNSFLLRGCSLKQTEYVFGVVIYVGHNTKIMKNSPSARSKTSKIENIMNFQIMVIFLFQISMSLMGAIFYIIWYDNYFDQLSNYIFYHWNKDQQNFFVMLLSRIGTWVLIFTNLVPISLLVTMEMVKYIQGMFISWDVDMYDQEKRIPAKVQTSTLNEELGQVKYIFTDKTGTLTKNYMEFRRMSVGRYIYGDKKHFHHREKFHDDKGDITNVNFKEEEALTEKFEYHLKNHNHENYQNIHLFLESLSLCHSVITDAKEEQKGIILFQASSPDEMCLVNAARYFGYFFQGRDINNKIFMRINNNEQEYQLLNLLEYSSERKKMSVIVKCPDNKIRIYCKGADSVIRDKITQNPELLKYTEDHLMEFAKEGLRTLMIAYREISEEEYQKWHKEYLNAISDPMNKEKYLPKVYDKIENNLYLIGATAIEDQLQEEVGETLEILIRAGIKIWMLTGDKMDTAKSIAFSCRLVTHDFILLEIPEKSSSLQIRNSLTEALKEIERDPNAQYALVISTDEISKIMHDSLLNESFYQLSIRCKAVVCCRVTPKQKAQMVHLIKDREEMNTTLAIGDGANDVNMITSAHIGVGLVGVEGTQAARSSDYSIGEFSFLRKLLLVHGRESYRKNSFIVLYNFYKNVLFVMPQFWFGFVSYFSGQTLYDPWIYQFFNIIFASIPIIWFGIYDKEIPHDELYHEPKYYTQGIVGKLFHPTRFWKWVFNGILQGFILFLFGYFAMNAADTTGRHQDLWSVGSMIYAGIVTIVNLKIFFSTNTHCAISMILFFGSILSYWFILFAMSHYYRFENFNNFYMLLTDLWFYMASASVFVLVLLLDIGITRLLYYCGVIKDGASIEAKKIDEHLKLNIGETNLLIEEKIRNKCKKNII
jgi:phospholipid-transporting ATPase